jgi:transcription elongation GreA/GreB family factor
MDAPLARAVMGKTSGDQARLQLPDGESLIIVERVEYK